MTANASAAKVLESIHWQLIQYVNESGDSNALLSDSPVDMQLSEGKFHGSAGCNRYFGSYSVVGEKLTIVQPIGATMKLCPPPVMEQEQAYLDLLKQVNTYHIDDQTLVLLDQAQQPVLKYRVQQSAELEETKWRATGINNGQGGVVSSANTELSTAQFLDGKLTGNAGCNQYSAGYTREDDKISIGPVMTTRKHCQESADIMQQEQEYLQAITGERILILGTRELELRNEKGALQVRFTVQTDTRGSAIE